MHQLRVMTHRWRVVTSDRDHKAHRNMNCLDTKRLTSTKNRIPNETSGPPPEVIPDIPVGPFHLNSDRNFQNLWHNGMHSAMHSDKMWWIRESFSLRYILLKSWLGCSLRSNNLTLVWTRELIITQVWKKGFCFNSQVINRVGKIADFSHK